MILSQIELFKPEQMPGKELKMIVPTSAPTIGNTTVVGSTVYLMDCVAGMKHYPDKWFDLAVVDPPYGIGMDNQKKRVKPTRPNSYTNYAPVKYNLTTWDSDIPTMEYFTELYRVSKNQIIC